MFSVLLLNAEGRGIHHVPVTSYLTYGIIDCNIVTMFSGECTALVLVYLLPSSCPYFLSDISQGEVTMVEILTLPGDS